MNTRKWEMTIISVDETGRRVLDRRNPFTIGEEGWELVQVSLDQHGVTTRYYFKREVIPVSFDMED